MITLDLIKERLRHLDEITLMEVLDISSEDILDRFEDFIEDRQEHLAEELADESYE
jgi:hypothetical protein